MEYDDDDDDNEKWEGSQPIRTLQGTGDPTVALHAAADPLCSSILKDYYYYRLITFSLDSYGRMLRSVDHPFPG